MTVTAVAPGAAALTAALLLAGAPAAVQAGSPWEAGKAAFEANARRRCPERKSAPTARLSCKHSDCRRWVTHHASR